MSLSLLVFGRSGQVATELRRLASSDFAVISLDRNAVDLSDPHACAALVSQTEADVVVNAAAYTAVDRAETEEALAKAINGDAPGAMARAAAARGLPFVHISTDYVFDGGPGRPWREDDPTGPRNAYGRSKLEGERQVGAAGGRHAILRTAWVHAAHGSNFVRSMLRYGAERDKLTIVDDQRGGPTAAADIATAIAVVARRLAEGEGATGVFHFCGAPTVSWRQFAEAIFDRADWIARPEIVPIASADWPTPAVRPANSALDCTRIAETFGIAQPDWRRSLDAIIAELRAEGGVA